MKKPGDEGSEYLTSIELSVESANIKPGERIQITAIGRDQCGQMISLDDVEWKAKGEEIENSGLFVAGVNKTGAFVTVTSEGIATTIPLKIM